MGNELDIACLMPLKMRQTGVIKRDTNCLVWKEQRDRLKHWLFVKAKTVVAITLNVTLFHN